MTIAGSEVSGGDSQEGVALGGGGAVGVDHACGCVCGREGEGVREEEW